jgi:hypothetical protein
VLAVVEATALVALEVGYPLLYQQVGKASIIKFAAERESGSLANVDYGETCEINLW